MPNRVAEVLPAAAPDRGVITSQAIRRGSFIPVKEPVAAIGAFTDSWNDHPRPFAWTKDAGEILASIHRAKTKANALTHH